MADEAAAPAGTAVTPPAFGEALGAGWNAYKANLVPGLLAFLVGMIVSVIPLAGLFIAAGNVKVALKLVRGEKPEIGDVFYIFKSGNLVDLLIMTILVGIGAILCGIGVLITAPLFMMGLFLLVDKGGKYSDGMNACMTRVKPNLVGWIIFVLVVGIVGGLGSILCGVGILLTMPIAWCAFAYAYEKTLKGA